MVSLLKVKQGLDLEIWKVGREQASQGEALLNLILDRTDPLNLILPEQLWEQALEQMRNLFHQVFRQDWKTCL